MGDLISRAAAMKAFMVKPPEYYHTSYIVGEINCLPNVDAVPVVRCASCKWWNGSALGVAHRCAALHIATTGEFYCAAAERKCNAFADQSGAEYAGGVDKPIHECRLWAGSGRNYP